MSDPEREALIKCTVEREISPSFVLDNLNFWRVRRLREKCVFASAYDPGSEIEKELKIYIGRN